MTAPNPGEDFTGHTEIELLRVIALDQRLVISGLTAVLDEMIDERDESRRSFQAAFGIIAGRLGHIDDTLSTFLQDWLGENTSPPDPATKVTLTWREPQAIPKGP